MICIFVDFTAGTSDTACRNPYEAIGNMGIDSDLLGDGGGSTIAVLGIFLSGLSVRCVSAINGPAASLAETRDNGVELRLVLEVHVRGTAPSKCVATERREGH